MGTYYIPRNVKGESRILYIFSVKALITTAISAFIGVIIYFLLSMVGLRIVGIVCIAVLAVIGYGIGTIKIPTLAGIPFTKKIGGEDLGEIILRYIKFLRNRKIYTYVDTKEKAMEKEENK